MRVLLYGNVDRAHAGGVQAVMRSLRAGLEARGHRVATGWAEDSSANGEPADGWVAAFPVRRGERRWLHLPTAARVLLHLLRARPEVVNVHYASPSTLYFIAFARWLGFRVVVTCHGSDILRPVESDVPYLKAVLSGADSVTAVSEEIATRIAETGATLRCPVAVIPNGVDTDFWQPARAPEGEDGILDLVAVGRLEPVKGFDLLIAALGALARREVPVRLVLAGEGSQREALAAQAERLGIAPQVIFAGRLAPPDLRARLRAADLFILPSRSEGMPLALMEAMASGIACVAADVGGVARTAAGSVQLVPTESPAALAAAIAELAGAPEIRAKLARQARTRALDFSVTGANEAYATLMSGVVREARA